MGNGSAVWDAQVSRLGGPFRVVAVDLAGHGDSGRGRADSTTPAFGEDVRAVVDAAGLARVVLVGRVDRRPPSRLHLRRAAGASRGPRADRRRQAIGRVIEAA